MQELEQLKKENESLKSKILEQEELIARLQNEFEIEEKLGFFLEQEMKKEAGAFLNSELSKELDKRLEHENYNFFEDYEEFKNLSPEEEEQILKILKNYEEEYKEINEEDINLEAVQKIFDIKGLNEDPQKGVKLLEKAILSLTAFYKKVSLVINEKDN